MTTRPLTTCDACGKEIGTVSGPGHRDDPGGFHLEPRRDGALQGVNDEGVDVCNLDCLGVWLARSGRASVIRYDDQAGLRQALVVLHGIES